VRTAADAGEADALGVALAERFLRDGAAPILAAVRAAAAPAVPEP
jgi:NAD(P)-dependent dehydrogenase (short-subunit alcohol dehydrogenase family)